MVEAKLLRILVGLIMLLVGVILVSNFIIHFDPNKIKTKDINPDEVELDCSQNIRYQIESICYDILEGEMYFEIKNTGSKDISGFNFIIEADIVQEKNEIISQGTTGKYIVPSIRKPTSFKAIPKISYNNNGEDETRECVKLSSVVSEVQDC
ncbi:hypothetical protein JXM83_02810 [Candidatus Woesearchaeota archaeon]|nr:hypothetical protein [Candidatus Woesearchaeota archaeon]